MCKYAVFAVFVLVAFVGPVLASGPMLSRAVDEDAQSVDPLATDSIEDATVPADTSSMIIEQPPAADCGCQDVTGCGCQETASCSPCCSPTVHLSFREKCAYYRSVRQSFDRGPCCADYFGGYGPLWGSYCCDKQRGWGAPAAACAPCRGCRPILGARARGHVCNACGAACCEAATACDCTGPAPMLPPEDEQPQPAIPPEPAPPAVPSESAASARPKFSPITTPAKSSRRGWKERTAQWRPSQ